MTTPLRLTLFIGRDMEREWFGASTQRCTCLYMHTVETHPHTHTHVHSTRCMIPVWRTALRPHQPHQVAINHQQEGSRSGYSKLWEAGKCSLCQWHGCMIPTIWNSFYFRKEFVFFSQQSKRYEFAIICRSLIHISIISHCCKIMGGLERCLRSNSIGMIFWCQQSWTDFF